MFPYIFCVLMISEGDRYVGGGPSRLRLHVSAGCKGQLPSGLRQTMSSFLWCCRLGCAKCRVSLSENRPVQINSFTALFLFFKVLALVRKIWPCFGHFIKCITLQWVHTQIHLFEMLRYHLHISIAKSRASCNWIICNFIYIELH